MLGWNLEALGPVIDGVRFVGQSVGVNYPEAGLTALACESGTGYWYDHRAQEVLDALSSTNDTLSIWDIGAGSGSMSGRFARAAYEVVAVEPLIDGARAIARLGVDTVFCGSLESLRLPSSCLRVVGLFDVIEHIDDPADLVSEVHRVLEPGGVVVLTVPALPLLWSDEDEVAGHKRRYLPRDLDSFMSPLGFKKVASQYLFASLVIPALLIRVLPYKLGRRRSEEAIFASMAVQLSPSRRIDQVMRRVLAFEQFASKRVRLPFGTSVMGLYRRTEK
jgi:SAM-dependent methyltransferase